MASEDELGGFIGWFRADTARRRRICATAVPLGAIGTVVGLAILVAVMVSDATPGVAFGFVAGLGIAALINGIRQGRLAATRPDEVFRLYEGGFVHAYGGTSRVITWDEITKVDNRTGKIIAGVWFGYEVYYRIKIDPSVGGDRTILITGIIDDAYHLGEAVRRAVQDGVWPQPA